MPTILGVSYQPFPIIIGLAHRINVLMGKCQPKRRGGAGKQKAY